eukprot:11222365-Lingulodinium_polyedra.AAC.1
MPHGRGRGHRRRHVWGNARAAAGPGAGRPPQSCSRRCHAGRHALRQRCGLRPLDPGLAARPPGAR